MYLHICEIKNEQISVSLTITIEKKNILHTHWLTRTYTRAHTRSRTQTHSIKACVYLHSVFTFLSIYFVGDFKMQTTTLLMVSLLLLSALEMDQTAGIMSEACRKWCHDPMSYTLCLAFCTKHSCKGLIGKRRRKCFKRNTRGNIGEK